MRGLSLEPGARPQRLWKVLSAIVCQNLEEVGGKLSAPLHVVLHSRRWAAV